MCIVVGKVRVRADARLLGFQAPYCMYFSVQHTGWCGNWVHEQGVDGHGLVGSLVRCSMLQVPGEGHFDIKFDWKA